MSKNLIYIGIVVVLIVVAGGYYLMKGKTDTAVVDTAPKEQLEGADAMDAAEVTVNLLEQNDSGESGTATLKEVNGKVMVSVKTTGSAADVAQPAHVHVGTCPEVGAVKYPLTSVVNGVSETELTATMADIKAGLPFGINVHKSQTQASLYTVCGDINI